jgi:hypothetical protein
VFFQTESAGTDRLNMHPAIFYFRINIDSHGAHIALDLVGGFLEGEIEAFATAAAGTQGKTHGKGALSGSCATRNQYRAATILPFAAKHLVQAIHAGGDLFIGSHAVQTNGGDGNKENPVLRDQEGILVRAMG